ncbi:MAG TPA: PP2C family protein-serine/threonine phosphatase [Acidimicrobiales bacterium]|nr:PP2C family protein-serine/threonine phosphatase [Acidimicrobiales bacterium]
MDHDRVAALLGAHALDAVDDDEAAAIEAHLPTCTRCRSELDAHREVAAHLAPSPAPVPDRLRASIAQATLHATGATRRPVSAQASGPGIPADTASLHDRFLADGFQRALVPRPIPDVDGWAIATAYEAAGDHLLVGGEFYDVLPSTDGSAVVLVGDVAGSGPAAALIALSIRIAVKAAARRHSNPASIMTEVDDTLASELADTLARVTVAVVRPDAQSVRVVQAGCPDPWLVAASRAALVETPDNQCFGMPWREPWRTTEIDVEPGATLLFYSNSLAEAWSDERGLADDAIAKLLRGSAVGSPCHELVLRLLEATNARMGCKADVIVAAVQRQPR